VTAVPSTFAERVLAGDMRALARAITMVENGDAGASLVISKVFPATGRAHVVGITGPPGVGKSTLVQALIRCHRGRNASVAALCVDPSSTLTHGALLGDRVRMTGFHSDSDVYIRSMATRGTLGGLTRAARGVILLMDGAGFEEVIVETVGVGQSELTVKGVVDTVVLVLMPGSGDSMQFLKAGVMEIPDVIVVNKRDRGGAEEFAAELRRAAGIGDRSRARPAIVLTDSLSGDGVEELADAVTASRVRLEQTQAFDERRAAALTNAVVEHAVEAVRERLMRLVDAGGVDELLHSVTSRETDPDRAAQLLLGRVLSGEYATTEEEA
jgi:LAO/AO transport system kinase